VPVQLRVIAKHAALKDQQLRDEVQRTVFSVFGPPIFSALRSASRAPISPAASAATLKHSRSSVCSIHRAGQSRLEKAADALKVSWGLPLPAESADQDIWKPLRGKLAQVSGKFFSGKKAAGRARRLLADVATSF
jgi:hypothetical protein